MAVPFKVTISAIGECNPSGIVIGRVGEYDVIQVQFDFSAWQEEIGAGVPNLIFQRNGDANPYPIVLSIDGTIATWTVSLTDTSVAGLGKAEIQYVSVDEGAFLGKSATIAVKIINTMQPAGDAPDPYESWIDTLTELASQTEAAEQAAAQSATDAENSALDAEAWAVGQRNGQDVPSTDPTYHNNSKYHSQEAANHEQGAKNWDESAEQHAVDAYDAKVAAEQAKQGAENAKVGAEDAEDDAQIYAAAAQQAKDDAEAYVTGLLNGTIIPDKAKKVKASTANGEYNVLLINGSDYNIPAATPDLLFDTLTRMLTTYHMTVLGDLDVRGTTTTVHAESVSTKEKYIALNTDATTLIGTAGFVVLKGNGTDAIGIVYDATDGFLKLGDGTYSNGTFTFGAGQAERLATIEENVTDGNLVEYDDTTKELKDSGYKASDFRTKGDFTAQAVGDGTYSLILNNGYTIEANNDGDELGTQCYTITLEGD